MTINDIQNASIDDCLQKIRVYDVTGDLPEEVYYGTLQDVPNEYLDREISIDVVEKDHPELSVNLCE